MPHPLLTQAIDALASGRSLSADDTAGVLAVVMAGDASDAQIAAFLIALRTKGETEEEIAGLARAMRQLATPVRTTRSDLLDTAGTGGGRPTFNVSTTAALIAAGAGCAVAKHGNRSATGLSGSADVLEALGARIDLSPEAVGQCIDEIGFGFMFAPAHHQATRFVVGVRKELAVRTIFNFLGPLTNPAGATRQLIGVSDPAYLERLAGALRILGGQSALVVSSDDGLDEVSASGVTRLVELKDGGTHAFELRPEDLDLEPAPPDAIPAGPPDENARILRAVTAGERGPARSLALANAGAAVYVAGGAPSIPEGVRRAEEAIDSGVVEEVLDRYLERTRALAPAAA